MVNNNQHDLHELVKECRKKDFILILMVLGVISLSIDITKLQFDTNVMTVINSILVINLFILQQKNKRILLRDALKNQDIRITGIEITAEQMTRLVDGNIAKNLKRGFGNKILTSNYLSVGYTDIEGCIVYGVDKKALSRDVKYVLNTVPKEVYKQYISVTIHVSHKHEKQVRALLDGDDNISEIDI